MWDLLGIWPDILWDITWTYFILAGTGWLKKDLFTVTAVALGMQALDKQSILTVTNLLCDGNASDMYKLSKKSE